MQYLESVPEITDRDPYTLPINHLGPADNEDGWQVLEGRRPSPMLLVQGIRTAVDQWRQSGYPGLSMTTERLFRWWFDELPATGPNAFHIYWGQREAVETVIYLNEVLNARDAEVLITRFADTVVPGRLEPAYEIEHTPDGNRLLRWYDARDIRVEKMLPERDLCRYAIKMATGSGKTVVVAMLTLWSFFHAQRERRSRMASNFLILAPNVIVFERLRVEFEDLRIFRQLNLVPPEWHLMLNVVLRGDTGELARDGNLVVTNIQQLHDRQNAWSPSNAIDSLLGPLPSPGGSRADRSLLQRLRDLENLVVLNDEAHHVHDEELSWHQVLMDLSGSLSNGLDLWLDFTATPRGQDGVTFPWVISDYPLAQAVEDRIVKAPVILHMVDQPDPTGVKADNVTDKYGAWLVAGVDRLRQHEDDFRAIDGVKPVMFIMCESIRHANEIGKWLSDPAGGRLSSEEVLVIHTDAQGEIRQNRLDESRRLARGIDSPSSKIRAVVSVLVLREGWDVRNVTVVLGLRPGTAQSQILPEQAVGRGLRLMRQVGPERRQVLEVLGTPAFENFVKQLENEGIFVPSLSTKPQTPITIQPVLEKAAMNIDIPRTTSGLHREYTLIETFDSSNAPPVFANLSEVNDPNIVLIVKDALTDATIGEIPVASGSPPLWHDILANIVNKTQDKLHVTSEFARLTPIVNDYLQHRCFGGPVDTESSAIRRVLGVEWTREKIATQIARSLGEIVTEKAPIIVKVDPISLLDTPPFHWRRDHLESPKTVFNFVASWNDLESTFAHFLDKCEDVTRFAALAEHFTGFWVDYLKPSGSMGRYFPDWVIVQESQEGLTYWIVETKGRVWEGTEAKDAAIEYWCNQVRSATGLPWRYMRVDQPIFRPRLLPDFASLVTLVEKGSAAASGQGVLIGSE